jgi:hypothetical protein
MSDVTASADKQLRKQAGPAWRQPATLGFVEPRLKANERLPYCFQTPQLSGGVVYGVILKLQKTAEFFLIEFFHALANILGEHKL